MLGRGEMYKGLRCIEMGGEGTEGERKARSDGEHRNPKCAGLYLSRKPICTFLIIAESLDYTEVLSWH